MDRMDRVSGLAAVFGLAFGVTALAQGCVHQVDAHDALEAATTVCKYRALLQADQLGKTGDEAAAFAEEACTRKDRVEAFIRETYCKADP